MNRKQLATIYEALNDAIEFCGPYVDVVDGDGAPEANNAMRLYERLHKALAIVDRELDAAANEARV